MIRLFLVLSLAALAGCTSARTAAVPAAGFPAPVDEIGPLPPDMKPLTVEQEEAVAAG